MIDFDKLPTKNDIERNKEKYIASIVNKAPKNEPFVPVNLFRSLYFSAEEIQDRNHIDSVLKTLLVDSGYAVYVGAYVKLTEDAKLRINSLYHEIVQNVDNSVKVENYGNFTGNVTQGGSSSKSQQIKSITAPPKKKDDQSKWYIKHSMKLIGTVILLIIAAIINYVFKLKV